jgi:hypothetical protein
MFDNAVTSIKAGSSAAGTTVRCANAERPVPDPSDAAINTKDIPASFLTTDFFIRSILLRVGGEPVAKSDRQARPDR